MKNRNKSILALGILALSLQACNNEIEEPKINTEAKDSPIIMLSANIDPTYEYDTEGLRAAQFTAEDAPRIKLTEQEISAKADGSNSLTGTTTLNNTGIRVNWLAFDNNNRVVGKEFLSIYKGFSTNNIKTEIELKESNGDYQLNAWIRMGNLTSIDNIPGATWFGQMILGGLPGFLDRDTGKEERAHQYFSVARRARLGGGEYSNTNPNHRIDELDGTNSTMARRHFPLVGKVVKLRLWNRAGVEGTYDNKGNNTGHIITDEKFYLKPRGTIFTVTLDNQTGEDIEVTDIEVPIAGTRGQAFSFEGLFNGLKSNPFKNGTLDPNGAVAPFEKYYNIDPYTQRPFAGIYPNNTLPETLRFPLYNRNGQRNISLTPDQKSGRLMVWAYVHEPNKPFTLRVKYRTAGSTDEKTSLIQTVNPPASGFKESMAYRFNFIVQP